jgi:hypothetical protein
MTRTNSVVNGMSLRTSSSRWNSFFVTSTSRHKSPGLIFIAAPLHFAPEKCLPANATACSPPPPTHTHPMVKSCRMVHTPLQWTVLRLGNFRNIHFAGLGLGAGLGVAGPPVRQRFRALPCWTGPVAPWLLPIGACCDVPTDLRLCPLNRMPLVLAALCPAPPVGLIDGRDGTLPCEAAAPLASVTSW